MSRESKQITDLEQVDIHLDLELPEPDESFWLELRERVWQEVDPDVISRRRRPLQVLLPVASLMVLCLALFWWWGQNTPLSDGVRDLAAIEESGRQGLDDLLAMDLTGNQVVPAQSAEDLLVELLTDISVTGIQPERILIADGVMENPGLWNAILNEELELPDVDDLIDQLSATELQELSTRLRELQG
jgi:hypothetical protein